MNENEQSSSPSPSSTPPPQPAEGGKSKSPLIMGIIVIVIVVLGFWWLSSDDSDTETNEAAEVEDAQGIDDAVESLFEDEDDEDDDSAALPVQPAPATPVADPATDAAAPAVTTIALTGQNFAFSQEEIRVKQGDTVRIEFESTEGFHDWVVDEFDAATDQVRPGTPTSVEFVASEAGTFEYYCSVGTHRQQGMVGNLIVE